MEFSLLLQNHTHPGETQSFKRVSPADNHQQCVNGTQVNKKHQWEKFSFLLAGLLLWQTPLLFDLPRDLTDLPVVHGVEDRGVAHPLADPQLDANACVEEQHGRQREQEKSHHDEGRVRLPVSQRAPTLLAAHVVLIIQEVVLHL